MQVENLQKHTAEVYNFRFKESRGWGRFTLCEETGEFSVQSDWGHGAFSWHYRGGDTLKEFLSTTSGSYVATKFSYDNPAFKRQYSPEATKDAVRKEILSRRRSGEWEKNQAALAWDDFNGADFEDWAVLVSFADSDFGEILDEYEVYHEEDSSTYAMFSKKLLPFFFNYLREELKNSASNHDGGSI